MQPPHILPPAPHRRVSILTGPEGPVQLGPFGRVTSVEEVSILTGPEGPVQRPNRTVANRCRRFQSSPVPKDRCNPASCARKPRLVVSILTGPEGPVQPSAFPSHVHVTEVSILTGPEGPVQPCTCTTVRGGSTVSILTGPEGPVQRTGLCTGGWMWMCFNPHRSRRTGATRAAASGWAAGAGFNPHRSRKIGRASCRERVFSTV
mgnify:CR=1 FL=1